MPAWPVEWTPWEAEVSRDGGPGDGELPVTGDAQPGPPCALRGALEQAV